MTKYLKAVNLNFLEPAQDLTLGKIYKLIKSNPALKMLWVENDHGEEESYFAVRFVEASEQEYMQQTSEPLKTPHTDTMLAYTYKEKLEEIKRMCEALGAFKQAHIKALDDTQYKVTYRMLADEVKAVCDIVVGIIDRDDF